MKFRMQAAVIVLAVLALVAAASAQPNNTDPNMPTGKAFIRQVAEINLAEVELGKLAQQRGRNAAVKQFGKTMVSDHSAAEKALQELASAQGVTLPSEPPKGASELHAQLSRLHGARFDRDYIGHMLQGHKGAIVMVENEILHGQDAAIQAFAKKVLPTIQDHIRLAENVAGRIGMTGKEGLSQPDKAIPFATASRR
jgi:putative membrane protein